MPTRTLKNLKPRRLFKAPEAPTAALERPQALKKWSGDIVEILNKERANLFKNWDFRSEQLTKIDFCRILKKITGCGSVLELRAAVDYGTGEISAPALHAANFCGQHTICPFCAGRVQDRRKARFREAIQGAARTFKRAYLVTATIPPVPNWRADLDQLLGAWKSFRKMGQKRRRKGSARSNGEWGKIRAGLAKVEIKRGDGSGLPHCHIHALFFTDEYFDFRVWSKDEKAKERGARVSLHENNGSKIVKEWQAATDGQATGLDVKLIKWKPAKRFNGEGAKEYADRAENWSYSDSVFEQSREVLKYATKFETAPAVGAEKLFAEDFIDIKCATYGRRLFHTYGTFRKVGGNDFEGSQCPISSHPIIYETRWRTDRYSPLMERSKPIFPNSDPGPGLSARLKVLNRIQGATRRIRRSIFEAKKTYLETGFLSPAVFDEREFLPGGGFTDRAIILEMPAAVLAAPGCIETWEDWTDAATLAGRARYNQAREDLDLESHFRIIGTAFERREQSDFVNRIYWNSQSYEDETIRAFLEILAPSSAPSS